MEKEILAELYKRYYRELYLYIYSICREKSAAEDILQETFLKALLSLKDSHTNMRAWLYLVARNLALNWIKRESRLVSFEEQEDRQLSVGRVPGRGNESHDVLDEMIWREEQRALLKALFELDKTKREVLVLRYFGGFEPKEIAAVLQLTPENVRVLLHRARKDLRRRMEAGGKKGEYA